LKIALRVSDRERLPVRIRARVLSALLVWDWLVFSMMMAAKRQEMKAPKRLEKLKIMPMVMPIREEWARVSLMRE